MNSESPPSGEIVLEVRNVSKSFPGVQALDDVSIELKAGKVLAIIGENGAGKSTLIKTLGGAHQPDSGTILLDGKPTALLTPLQSREHGIAVIYQEFNLVPFLTVRENLFLGQSLHRFGWVDKKSESRRAKELFQKLGLEIHPERIVQSLSIAEQQLVEIAKALLADIRILIMDEPTATLTPPEVEKLFRIVNDLKNQGIAIAYISHRLDEILEISDEMVVLRDGKRVANRTRKSTDRNELIQLMVGRPIEQEFPKQTSEVGPIRLVARNLCWKNRVKNVSLELRVGEVLGITGLVGAGRTEVAQLIAGAERPDSGTIEIAGKSMRFRNPADAIRSGIAFLTEDRKQQGLVINQNVRHNFGLPNLDAFSRYTFLKQNLEKRKLNEQVQLLKIKLASDRQLAGQLSGGNQQKLVLAKWLETNSDIIIIDEPTRGIDVGAKYEIYLLINRLAAAGKSIILISSEMPEVLGMADRILVMRNGSIAGEISSPQNASQDQIMQLAAL